MCLWTSLPNKTQFLQLTGVLKAKKALQNGKVLPVSITFSFISPRQIKHNPPAVNKTPVSTPSIFRMGSGILQHNSCAPRGAVSQGPLLVNGETKHLHSQKAQCSEEHHPWGEGWHRLWLLFCTVGVWLFFIQPFIRKSHLRQCPLPIPTALVPSPSPGGNAGCAIHLCTEQWSIRTLYKVSCYPAGVQVFAIHFSMSYWISVFTVLRKITQANF